MPNYTFMKFQNTRENSRKAKNIRSESRMASEFSKGSEARKH